MLRLALSLIVGAAGTVLLIRHVQRTETEHRLGTFPLVDLSVGDLLSLSNENVLLGRQDEARDELHSRLGYIPFLDK